MSEWKRIDSIASVRRGASPRPIGDPRYFGGNIGWVRIVDVTGSKRFLRETEQYLSPLGESLSVRVNPGDLVMSICATLGRPIIIDMPACIHDGFVQFSNLQDTDTSFLFYALQHAEPAFCAMGQPGTQTNLNTSLVGRHVIFCPEKRVQRGIAEILSTLDETIEQTEALIAKYQQIKSGLMHDLFTRGVTPDGKLRPTRAEAPQLYKQSPLGWIPKEWEVVKGRDLFDLYGGSSPNTIREDGSGDCLYLKVDDFNDERNGELLRRSRASFKKAENPSLRTFYSGAIVFPKRGAAIFLNRVGVLHGEGTVDPNLMVALVKNTDYTDFIQLSLLQKGLFNICDNSGIPQINNKHLYPLDFALPPVIEVDHIREAMRCIQTRVSADQSFLSKLRQQKYGIMHDLLTGHVRVKVNA